MCAACGLILKSFFSKYLTNIFIHVRMLLSLVVVLHDVMKVRKIGIVGATGLVGRELLRLLLDDKKFSNVDFELFSSKKSNGELIELCGRSFVVKNLSDRSLKCCDVWFFASPPAVSSKWIPKILSSADGYCIDGSPAFRGCADIPLVIPEINGECGKNRRLISSPNCTTTIALMGLSPLHNAFKLKKFWLHSYQAVSGIGYSGLIELNEQINAYSQKLPMPFNRFFPKQIAFNAIPQVGRMALDESDEEAKIIFESRKIMGLDGLPIFASCVRVPVLRCHSISINAEFCNKFALAEAEMVLSDCRHLKFYKNSYPTAVDCDTVKKCGIGRLRSDSLLENGLSFWIVGDQLLKGAALNMVQIFKQCILS